jgi:hypothetical protein
MLLNFIAKATFGKNLFNKKRTNGISNQKILTKRCFNTFGEFVVKKYVTNLQKMESK